MLFVFSRTMLLNNKNMDKEDLNWDTSISLHFHNSTQTFLGRYVAVRRLIGRYDDKFCRCFGKCPKNNFWPFCEPTSEILSSPIYSSIHSNTEHLSVQITPAICAITDTVNEFTEFSKFYKRNDAQTRMVNLKIIAITLGSIAQWSAHFPSNEEILGLNPFWL